MLKQIKYKNKVYTVDYRLKEFRFIEYGKMPEFIPFDSELGIKLLSIDGETINRFGSGDAEITGVGLYNKEGGKIDYCKYGDDVKVTYRVLFKKQVEEPIFGLRITDYRGNIIFGTNTRLNKIKTGTFKSGDKVSVNFSFRVNLMGGEYSVSPAVGYNDNKTYCDWVNDMFTINVIHKNIAEGLADLNPEINIEK